MTMEVRRCSLITEVKAEGEKVIAVAIDMGIEIAAHSLTKRTFTITIDGMERSITRIYLNNKFKVTTQPLSSGTIVIIECDERDVNSGTLIWEAEESLTHRRKLVYEIKQQHPVKTKCEKDNFLIKNTVTNTDEIQMVVDKFSEETFKGDLVELKYRLFKPEIAKNERKPLILFLHGMGERGTKNDVQLLMYRGAITWAEDEFQKTNPAFVVAPQLPIKKRWTDWDIYNTVLKLINDLLGTYAIDHKRIYVTGISMGGMGTWKLIEKNPSLFAGAIPVCGMGTVERAKNIADVPIWAFHSEDDDTVSVSGTRDMMEGIKLAGGHVIKGKYAGNKSSEEAERAAEELVKRAERKTTHTLYTEYIEGTTPINSHRSWIPAYDNATVKKWLFHQVNQIVSNNRS